MSFASILLLAVLAVVASASENPKPLVEHSIRVQGHIKCAGVPVENATVSLVFVVPNPDKEAKSDELTGYNEPEIPGDYTSIESEYPINNTVTFNLTNSANPGSSSDYVVGNNSEVGEVPTGYDYPDNDTDLTIVDRTDEDLVGHGASLASDVNGSVNAVVGSEDYYELSQQELLRASEREDVLDRTLTSANGAYRVEGKIIYAPGDYTWKLQLQIQHICHNGTTENEIPFNSIDRQDLSTYGVYAEGKKQFQVDVELNKDEDEPEDSEYKTAGSVDY